MYYYYCSSVQQFLSIYIYIYVVVRTIAYIFPIKTFATFVLQKNNAGHRTCRLTCLRGAQFITCILYSQISI